MIWLVLAAIVVGALVWGAFTLRRGGTVYFLHANGYTSYPVGRTEKQLRPVSPDRYETILRRFIQGDLFDGLWVAYDPGDDDGGLVVIHDAGEVRMDVLFRSQKEPQRVAEFRKSMQTWGYVPSAENPWNVGLGADLESVTLQYRFEQNLGVIRTAVDRALTALEGPAGEQVFVQVWNSKDFPTGIGIKFAPNRDLLAEVP